MNWPEVMTIIGANIALFGTNIGLLIWFRTESRNDWRHMDNKLDTFMKGIQAEMKDFHERLLKIEMEKK